MAWRGSDLLYCDIAPTGGIFEIQLHPDKPSPVSLIRNAPRGSTSAPVEPHSLVYDGNAILFTDMARRQVLRLATDGNVSVVCGSGKSGFANGAATDAAFNEPTGICREGLTLYVADAGGSIRVIVTDTRPLCVYLEHMHSALTIFGVHLPNLSPQRQSLPDAIECLSSLLTDLKRWNRAINVMRGAREDARVQGPEGAVPTKTVLTVEMLLDVLKQILRLLERVNPSLAGKIRLEACLSLAVENYFAIMRSWNPTPTVLEYMYRQVVVAKEMIRRLTQNDFYVFTSTHSHYSPVDRHDVSVRFSDMTFPGKLKGIRLSRAERRELKQFADQGRGLRQVTIRQMSTKFKAGAVPHLAYAETPMPGSLHDFLGPSVASVENHQIHALNDSLVTGQWLGVFSSGVSGLHVTDGVFVLGRCSVDSNDVRAELRLSVFVALPQTPSVFSLWDEVIVRKSAVFAAISQDNVSRSSDEEEEWELDNDARDELLKILSNNSELDDMHDDERSLEEKVAAASTNSSTSRSRRANSTLSKSKPKRRKRPTKRKQSKPFKRKKPKQSIQSKESKTESKDEKHDRESMQVH